MSAWGMRISVKSPEDSEKNGVRVSFWIKEKEVAPGTSKGSEAIHRERKGQCLVKKWLLGHLEITSQGGL